jgi:hypothetical protein
MGLITAKYAKYAKNRKIFNAKAQRREGAREEMGLNFKFFFASLRRGVFALNSGPRGFALCGKMNASLLPSGEDRAIRGRAHSRVPGRILL